MDDLKKLRDRIDWLDEQIASLLNERMRASDRVGEIKRRSQQEITDPSREKNVLNQVKAVIQHPLLKANIESIYGEIMQESRIAQKFFQHLSQPFRHIGIIGLGLIGGSICKALKTKAPSLMIGSIEHPSLDNALAQEGGWVDHVYPNIATLIEHCELIILASPISTIIPIAEEIKKHHSDKKIIVMDVSGVKTDIAKAFENLSCHHVEFIATHPMAGKELSGFTNSQATLFVNRPWIIVVPHGKNQQEGVNRIEEFLRYLGSNPITLEAKVHDQQAALVSHIPAILAKSYFEFVNATDPDSLKIAGPGFQSFTRLAHDNPEMMEETSQYNQKIIQDYLNQWLEFLKNTNDKHRITES